MSPQSLIDHHPNILFLALVLWSSFPGHNCFNFQTWNQHFLSLTLWLLIIYSGRSNGDTNTTYFIGLLWWVNQLVSIKHAQHSEHNLKYLMIMSNISLFVSLLIAFLYLLLGYLLILHTSTTFNLHASYFQWVPVHTGKEPCDALHVYIFAHFKIIFLLYSIIC